ncbi:MAG TPA: 16S rRNA (adenine(1518)-N(6)/adenine(1519)-N(6))-dimethyltransferase RsmA [Nitrospiria bacterium]|jgi:16S rRNA (adenine1518-N6/adenine1519-N6)-dimethyltransferase|nr:16S rRNA (adenine(1518)-N(6)/adenine(1519)-N(6))-dimethyltransferase RsmA [Nitrospiria bacterium]
MMRSKRKALGQHFLHDQNIVRKILSLADIRPDETVVEIGPGHGALTRALSEPGSTVYAIELDRRLHGNLLKQFGGSPQVRIIQADALTYPFEDLPSPFAVVANLPYSISTPLLFRLLELRTHVSRMILMVQLEVARRIVAREGRREYSPLSIGVQYYSQPRLEFIVPRGCFRPKPRVDSAVLSLEVRRSPSVAVKDEAFFFRVVRAGFAHRRKSLRNALKDAGFPPEAVENALSAAAITTENPQRRAETLSIEAFARLADRLLELDRGRDKAHEGG